MKNAQQHAELLFQQIKTEEIQVQYDIVEELEKKIDALKRSKIDALAQQIEQIQHSGKSTSKAKVGNSLLENGIVTLTHFEGRDLTKEEHSEIQKLF